MYLSVSVFPEEIEIDQDSSDHNYPVTIRFAEKGESSHGVYVYLRAEQVKDLLAQLVELNNDE